MTAAALILTEPLVDRRKEQAYAVLTVPLLLATADGSLDPFSRTRLSHYCSSCAVFNDFSDAEIHQIIDDVVDRIRENGVRHSFDKARRSMASSLREDSLSFAIRLTLVDDNTEAQRAGMIADMAKLLRISADRLSMLRDMSRILQAGPV